MSSEDHIKVGVKGGLVPLKGVAYWKSLRTAAIEEFGASQYLVKKSRKVKEEF